MLDDTDASLDLLAGLSVSFDTVDSQTSALRERSQALLSEQTRISALADDIRDNLEYYNYLDPITRRLNAPGARHFVRGDDFTEMLINLDDCLDYMQNHVSSNLTMIRGCADLSLSLTTQRRQPMIQDIAYCSLERSL